MNTISVIVPVYNLENELERSIGTILRQKHTDLEVIAVDDGSTDGSLAVLERIARSDSRLIVIHQENGGVTSARLKGLQAATGDWIGFVDGDDEIESDMYEHLLRNAIRYDADISHCGYQMVFPSRVDYYYNTGKLLVQDRQTGVRDLIEAEFIEPTLCSKLFRRALLVEYLKSGKVNSSLRYNEDLLMNFYLFRQAERSVYEDFCPYHYVLRVGSAATSKLSEAKLRDPLHVLHIIKEETRADTTLQNAVNGRLATNLIGLVSMRRKGQPDFVRQCCEKAQKELKELAPIIRTGPYSRKLKMMTALATMSPALYRAVHGLYAKLKGTDRKYEVK